MPAPGLVVRVGLALRVGIGDVAVLEILKADEIERESSPATAVFGRHEHVDLGVPTVPHVVHEGDLAAQVVAVTPVAIEKHPQRLQAIVRPLGLARRTP